MPSRSILEHRQEDDLHCDSHPFPGGSTPVFPPWTQRPWPPGASGWCWLTWTTLWSPTGSPQLTAWRDALAAQGIALFILSNSRKPGRAQNFAQALGVPFQGRSGKPRRRGYLQAMERMGCTPAQTVMVGDQIFTDTLGANNAGVTPLLVEPIQLAGNPGRYLRYAAETPFRLLGKRRPFL